MTGKKYLAATAGILTTSLFLVGCAGDESNSSADTSRNAEAEQVELTITSNAISGGKNAAEADWIKNFVIPEFEERQAEKGVDATVEFVPSGVDAAEYKTKISLDLRSGGGADVLAIDGIWVGEFAEAGYLNPLNEVVGEDVAQAWPGWNQIKPAVQQLTSYQDELYGIPDGTDGRVIYVNKELFQQAGLPTDWQPQSWKEIVRAAEKLKSLEGVTPLQINAGTAMAEATTMQGVLPLLVGTGDPLWKNGKWQGASEGMEQTLGLYSTIYTGAKKLGDPQLQQAANGRGQSFELFANGNLGMLIESGYFWNDIIDPSVGTSPMESRDEVVGWAKIPAMKPGAGIHEQDFVSMSGGGGRVLNPNTEYPQQAFELLTFMSSPEAVKASMGDTPRISARDDVNAEVLADEPLMSFIAGEVLPITHYRPSLPIYTQVSSLLQEATADVVNGTSPEKAAQDYQEKLEELVGGPENIIN